MTTGRARRCRHPAGHVDQSAPGQGRRRFRPGGAASSGPGFVLLVARRQRSADGEETGREHLIDLDRVHVDVQAPDFRQVVLDVDRADPVRRRRAGASRERRSRTQLTGGRSLCTEWRARQGQQRGGQNRLEKARAIKVPLRCGSVQRPRQQGTFMEAAALPWVRGCAARAAPTYRRVSSGRPEASWTREARGLRPQLRRGPSGRLRPGPGQLDVSTVPSVMRTARGSASPSRALAAGTYCRELASIAATVLHVCRETGRVNQRRAGAGQVLHAQEQLVVLHRGAHSSACVCPLQAFRAAPV